MSSAESQPHCRPLQRGRDLSIAETTPCGTSTIPDAWLQRGRDLSIAETLRVPDRRAGARASKGPRPFDRGDPEGPRPTRGGPRFKGAATFRSRRPDARARVTRARGRRFKGAATFRSRRRACDDLSGGHRGASKGPRPFDRGDAVLTPQPRTTRVQLQRGRDLSIAETIWRAITSTSDRCSFKGAATFRSRRLAARQRGRVRLGASKGPRPFDRGDAGSQPMTSGRSRSFKGAATFRSRRHVSAVPSQPEVKSFKGAATFRSRRPAARGGRGQSPPPGFKGAATFRSRRPRGPGCPSARRARFKGAATFRSRRPGERRRTLPGRE